jgi:hypothetical protein
MPVNRVKPFKTLRLISLVAVILFALVTILGKGGGGGDASPQPPDESSNWDTMVWDQDNWG